MSLRFIFVGGQLQFGRSWPALLVAGISRMRPIFLTEATRRAGRNGGRRRATGGRANCLTAAHIAHLHWAREGQPVERRLLSLTIRYRQAMRERHCLRQLLRCLRSLHRGDRLVAANKVFPSSPRSRAREWRLQCRPQRLRSVRAKHPYWSRFREWRASERAPAGARSIVTSRPMERCGSHRCRADTESREVLRRRNLSRVQSKHPNRYQKIDPAR